MTNKNKWMSMRYFAIVLFLRREQDFKKLQFFGNSRVG
jgi:hypothetical protein